MIDWLARRRYAVYLLLAAYFTVNVILRLAGPASLELDEGQQLFFAQWLAVGYDSQPPFYNWLQYWVVQLFGDTVLAVSLLKNLMLFLSYLLFGLAANLVIRDKVLAVIATLGLITVPQVGYEAQRDLTHTVGVLFAACMFAYFFVRTLLRPTALNYALTGVAIALGVLSKYNFVVLPVIAALALLPDRQWRARLYDVRVLLMIAVSAAIVAPHALWFLDHVDEATGRTVLKLTVGADGGRLDQIGKGFLSLAGAIAAFALPTLLAFLVAFGSALLRSWKAQSQWTRLIGCMFAMSFVVLASLVVFGGASNVKDRWLVPLLVLLPIYLGAKLEASGETFAGASRRFGAIVVAIMVLVPLVLLTRPFVMGAMGAYGKQNVPYGPAVAEILAAGKDGPSVILAADQQLAGNFRLHAPHIPVVIPGYGPLSKPFAFDATHPVLAVWRRNGKAMPKLSAGMRAWLDGNAGLAGRELDVRDAALPYHYGRAGDVYHFSHAWVYPPPGG
ncbi:glycosyltransferase family 39 protein [Mesorhizobium sp. KR9-304]|uniref:ArnT family glycosyltransferase n=1 Tax=Mesorhizobium sp. KR9-304 TaxID=3156614 RepID=UPI0032B4C0F9